MVMSSNKNIFYFHFFVTEVLVTASEELLTIFKNKEYTYRQNN